MDESELTRVVGEVGALMQAHYVFPDVAAAVSRTLAEGVADGRYPAEAPSLAAAVTADLQPILFPAVISGESINAAMALLAGTDALVIDLRHCLGGEPSMPAFITSYLWDHEPAQLSGLRERGQLKQSWTLPYVPGGRFGKAKPVYVLTGAAT